MNLITQFVSLVADILHRVPFLPGLGRVDLLSEGVPLPLAGREPYLHVHKDHDSQQRHPRKGKEQRAHRPSLHAHLHQSHKPCCKVNHHEHHAPWHSHHTGQNPHGRESEIPPQLFLSINHLHFLFPPSLYRASA